MTSVQELPSLEKEHVLDQYPTLYGDQQVLVIDHDDYRVPTAMAIEKANMLLLGDPEELVDKDLPLDLDRARFLTIYPRTEQPGLDNMLGVVRVTDADPDTSVLKSLREASEVTGEDYEEIFGHFVTQTGQTDPSKVYDINTYGMSEAVWQRALEGDKSLFQDVKYNLMYAMTHEGIRMRDNRGATHGIAYFNADSWEYFKHKGYNWVRLNGYEPKHDAFVTDRGEVLQGQLLIPTVLDIEQHIERMRAHTTQHLGEMASHLFAADDGLRPRTLAS